MATGNWRKSRRSGQGGSNCVEGRLCNGRPQLSDSKLADNRPIMDLDRTNYTSLLSMIKTGELDQE